MSASALDLATISTLIVLLLAALQTLYTKIQTRHSRMQYEIAKKSADTSNALEKKEARKPILRDISHEFFPAKFDRLEDHKIHFSIFGVGEESSFVRQVDWGFQDSDVKIKLKCDQVFPAKAKKKGLVITNTLDDIDLEPFIRPEMGLLKKIDLIERLQLETSLTTESKPSPIPLPRSLKVALFRKYSNRDFMNWLSEFIIKDDARFG